MLGKTLHVRNSAFRMLPNPTPYHWDKNFFNLRRLVKEYCKKIHDQDAELPPVDQLQQLREDSARLVSVLDRDKASDTPGHSLELLNGLHKVLDNCDTFLKEAKWDLVRMVVREHFQEVLRLINEKSGADEDTDGHSTRSGDNRRAEHFGELTAASPELRQERFMDLYFFKVLGKVRERAVMSYQLRQDTHYAPSTRSRGPSIDSAREAQGEAVSPTVSATPSRPISPGAPQLGRREGSRSSVPMLHVQGPDRGSQPFQPLDLTTLLESEASAIWCTLILRMLCWLLLHDFDKKDVQIAKSELRGSRLPVYVA